MLSVDAIETITNLTKLHLLDPLQFKTSKSSNKIPTEYQRQKAKLYQLTPLTTTPTQATVPAILVIKTINVFFNE